MTTSPLSLPATPGKYLTSSVYISDPLNKAKIIRKLKIFFSVNSIEAYETERLTLFCGQSGSSGINNTDSFEWETARTEGIEGVNKSVIVNTSRSYEEILHFESLTLKHGGRYRCGGRTLELKVQGEV